MDVHVGHGARAMRQGSRERDVWSPRILLDHSPFISLINGMPVHACMRERSRTRERERRERRRERRQRPSKRHSLARRRLLWDVDAVAHPISLLAGGARGRIHARLQASSARAALHLSEGGHITAPASAAAASDGSRSTGGSVATGGGARACTFTQPPTDARARRAQLKRHASYDA